MLSMEALEREVHVYHLNLALYADGSFRGFLPLLAEDERGRAALIRHGETQRNFITVRYALRALIGRYTSRPPGEIQFIQGDNGKPRLAGSLPNRGLVFNVSHSGDVGLIALARETALGVDVEKQRDMADLEGMAGRCFSSCEMAQWRALPQECRVQAFFNLWSFKEAFVKATGRGLALGLASCQVENYPYPRLIAVPQGFGAPEHWNLVGINAGNGYTAGLCYYGAERQLRIGDAAAFVNT